MLHSSRMCCPPEVAPLCPGKYHVIGMSTPTVQTHCVCWYIHCFSCQRCQHLIPPHYIFTPGTSGAVISALLCPDTIPHPPGAAGKRGEGKLDHVMHKNQPFDLLTYIWLTHGVDGLVPWGGFEGGWQRAKLGRVI